MSDYIYIVWAGIGYVPNEPEMMLATTDEDEAESFLRALRLGLIHMPAYYPALDSVRIERLNGGFRNPDGSSDLMTIDQALGPVQ